MAFPIGHLGRIALCCSLLLCLSAEPGGAETTDAAGEPQPSLLLDQLRPADGFVYRQTGRPDPFLPFMTTLQPAGEEEDPEELTGLRRFEPGQLRLTAIVLGAGGPLAMVEDASGLGYIIRAGTAIGRSGRVERIAAGRVVIRQEMVSWTGESQYRTVEMVLNPEGEE